MNTGNIYTFIQKHTNFQKEVGISIPSTMKELGSGTRGTAYDIGNGKALKITDDLAEAAVAEQMKNKDLRGLYKTFGAYKFTNSPTPEQILVLKDMKEITGIKKSYFIVMEKLKENNARAMKIQNCVDYLRDNMDDVPNFVYEEWNNDILKKFLDDKDTMEFITKKYGKPITNDMVDLAYGLNNLNKMGIKYSDLHAGNIMFNAKGRPVLIDIGYSSGSSGKPKMFEHIGPY
jgi:serine/threonine protein kinase